MFWLLASGEYVVKTQSIPSSNLFHLDNVFFAFHDFKTILIATSSLHYIL